MRQPVGDGRPQSIPMGDYARRKRVRVLCHDQKEVLKRVQMLNATKINVLSLEPGDRWEKKLCGKIHDCDMFMLFWSQAAKDSEWVMREVEYALKQQSTRHRAHYFGAECATAAESNRCAFQRSYRIPDLSYAIAKVVQLTFYLHATPDNTFMDYDDLL